MNIVFKTYTLIERAVEDGIICGINKAYKHTDNPTEGDLKEMILENIMSELDQIIDFDK
jgi:hypothetical protein